MRRITVIITLVMLAAAYIVMAAPTGSLTHTSPSWKNASSAPTSIDVEGGNYSFVNITLNQQTTNWAVLYGQIDSILVMKGLGGVTAFQWGTAVPNSRYVFFSNISNVDWANLAEANWAGQTEAEDDILGLTPADVDSVSSTFSALNNQLISYDAVSIAANSAFNIQTRDNVTSYWNTSMTWDTTNEAAVYVAHVRQNHKSFDSKSVDYQVILPTGDAVNRTYYMFVAIS